VKLEPQRFGDATKKRGEERSIEIRGMKLGLPVTKRGWHTNVKRDLRGRAVERD